MPRTLHLRVVSLILLSVRSASSVRSTKFDFTGPDASLAALDASKLTSTTEKPVVTCTEGFSESLRKSAVCPAACPLMQYDSNRTCHLRCITAGSCRAAQLPPSWPDLAAGMCRPCEVAGCFNCGSGRGQCERCREDFDLKYGLCVPKARHAWHAIYLVLGLAALVLLWYLLCLAFRPVVNQEVLEQALAHRSRSKVRHDGEGHHLYPLSTNLAGEMSEGGSVGVTLFFRFHGAMLTWAVLGLLLFGAAAAWSGRITASRVLGMSPVHEETLRACSDTPSPQDFEEVHRLYMHATGLFYVLTTAGALWFALSQRRTYQSMEDEATTMADFALCCSGFPKDAWGALGLEEEYLRFFRGSWGESAVVGVSIVWDTEAAKEEVEKLLSGTMHALEALPCAAAPTPQTPQAAGRRGCPAWAQLGFLDKAVWRALTGASATHDDEVPRAEQVAALEGMTTTGSAFVVLRTQRELAQASKVALPKFRGLHDIEVVHVDCEPETVLWEGFAVESAERWWLVLRGVAIVAATILMWALCFWWPLTAYHLSWQKVAGMSEGLTQDTLVLGLLLALGNQIVYAQCARVAAEARFKNRDDRDMLNMVLYTSAVLINMSIDLWLVAMTTQGFQRDSGYKAEASMSNPSMQHALFAQVVAMYPGFMLIPSFVEPLAHKVPFAIKKWLVRAHSGIGRWEAERALECLPYDLLRYGDVTANAVLVVLLSFLTSTSMWWGYFMLSASCLTVYSWDHLRFLRLSSRTCFATKHLDVVAQYLAMVPCAALAGVYAFKLQGGQAMTQRWGKQGFFDYHMEWTVCAIAVYLHLVLHVLLLKVLVPALLPPKGAALDVPYPEAAARIAGNWFNTNPVHCLRSMHCHAHEPPHVFFVPGKEYLQKRNHEVHAYYQAEHFDKEGNAMDDVRELVASELGHLWCAHRRERQQSGQEGQAEPAEAT